MIDENYLPLMEYMEFLKLRVNLRMAGINLANVWCVEKILYGKELLVSHRPVAMCKLDANTTAYLCVQK